MSGMIDSCLQKYTVNSNNIIKYDRNWLHKAKSKAINNICLNWKYGDYDIIDDCASIHGSASPVNWTLNGLVKTETTHLFVFHGIGLPSPYQYIQRLKDK